MPPDELLSLPFVRFRSVLVSSCLRPLPVANISDGSMKRSVDSYESWREHERKEELDSVTFAVCARNTMTRGSLARFFTRHPTKKQQSCWQSYILIKKFVIFIIRNTELRSCARKMSLNV